MPVTPVDHARRLADEVLAPTAEVTDQSDTVPRGHLALLAEAGLMGLHGPLAAGGLDASGPTIRAVERVLGGACGATSFVWAQHHGPVRLLTATPNDELRDRWLPRLCRGEVLAGTAFAHLRRPGPAAVTATRVPGGWRLDGEVPWATSWGLAEVYSLAAFTTDGDVLWAMIEARDQDGLAAGPPLRLAAMQATATVRLRLDGFVVPDTDVALVVPPDLWWAIDDTNAARVNPAVLGLADTALALLGRQEAPAAEAAGSLAAELARCSDHAEALAAADEGGLAEVDSLAAARAWAIDLAQRSSLALVAAVGGRAVERTHPAQRLAREATFYAVQAQTGPGRVAALRRHAGARLIATDAVEATASAAGPRSPA